MSKMCFQYKTLMRVYAEAYTAAGLVGKVPQQVQLQVSCLPSVFDGSETIKLEVNHLPQLAL